MCIIHFSNGTDFLTLRIHGRVKPDSQSFWDANWLHCTAQASAGAFSGILEWQLRNEDLKRFLNGLVDLDMRVGEALLDTGDGWLDIRVIHDEKGQNKARCQLVDDPIGGNSLEFSLLLDQTIMQTIISQIREVLEQFPVIGQDQELKRE